ncbi:MULTISPECIES: hypothetical protein [Vibrio]|uniref:hypothetical protein n=1 Tax=Vibrio TaxID=662 RepID=UPI0008419FCA|nr:MULTISPECIES: hypothetical protein [Vibrio]ODM57036.1 hypothetical protein BC455_18260 [Vibrio harveyi]USD58621.1 hypothetical protein J4N44_27090 [Vibrio sp. SCSIO 43155]
MKSTTPKKFELSTQSSIAEIYSHFTKAKNDESLDTMYEGLKKKLSTIEASETELTILSNNIYIAYGRRQEYFDGQGRSKEDLTSIKVETIKHKKANLSPEELLGEALRSLDK